MSSSCADSAVCVLELQRPICSQDFGVTCDATGEKCHKTWASCKDKCSYECATQSLYFSSCELPPAYGINSEPTLSARSIQRRGTKLSAKGISDRGYTVLDIHDRAHNDVGLDPYWPRADSPLCAQDMPGSYWSRLIARQCWFNGMKAILHNGDCSIPFENYKRETMYVESVNGTPGRKNGNKIRIKMQDPLFLLSGAMCPREEDFLAANIIENFQTEQPLYLGVNLDGIPDGDEDEADPNALIGQQLLAINYVRGNADQDGRFSRIKHICVDKEILRVRPVFNSVTPAGWNLELIERGVCGTEISEHDPGSLVFAAETFSDEHVVDVALRMIRDCARIEYIAQNCCTDAECLIGMYSFDKYRCDNPLQIICGDVVICKPEDVGKLLLNMSKVFGFDIYLNSETNRIEMISSQCPDISDVEPYVIPSDIIKGFDFKELYPTLSHVVINHSPIDWADKDSESNLAGKTILASEDSLREPCDRRTIRSLSTETINTMWINECNEYIANVTAYRLLRAREKPVYEASMEVPTFIGENVTVAQYVVCASHSIPTITGEPSDMLWRVTSKTPGKLMDKITLESTHFDADVVKCIECPEVKIVAASESCEELDCAEIC